MEALKLLAAGIGMGWGPCLAFWGPILLPYIAATKEGWEGGLRASAMFSVGRLLALAMLGGLASVAFASLNRFFPPHRSGYLYLAMALFIMLVGVLIVLGRGFSMPVYRVLGKQIMDGGTESMLILGFLMGISPCAPLVAILTYIGYTAANALSGMIYGLSFAVGTIVPVMILGPLAGFLPERVFRSARSIRVFRTLCGVILILFGLQLFYSVWQLLAIALLGVGRE